MGRGGVVEQHDEVFESIPWDRLGSLDRSADQRKWALVALAVAIVGVAAFFVRQAPVPAAPITATPATDPVVETTPPTTEVVLVAEEDLWAPAPPSAEAQLVAERFVIETLAGAGMNVMGVTAGTQPSSPDGTIRVLAVLDSESGPETIAFAVEVTNDGEVSRWGPAAVEPLVVKEPTPGAEPPPEILSEFTRIAGRWGTTLEVLSSGLAAERWWAEILVRLPSGVELPVMVWEGS